MPKAPKAAEIQPKDSVIDQAAAHIAQPPAEGAAQIEKPTAASAEEIPQVVKARVLCECSLGKANQVVLVDQETLQAMKDMLDAAPAAVEYAESL